jgi:hypothetical protein
MPTKKKTYTKKKTASSKMGTMKKGSRKTYSKKMSRYSKKNTLFKKTNYVTSQPMRELAVYLNPFSMKTQAPRIPDGSRMHTLGTSYRSQVAVGGATVQILLMPGFSTFGVVSASAVVNANVAPNWNATPSQAIADSIQVATRPLTNTTGMLQSWVNGAPADGDAIPDTAIPANATSPVVVGGAPLDLEAWRMVSCGLKIRSTACEDKGCGYYRAVRLKSCHFNKLFFPGGIIWMLSGNSCSAA